VAALLYFHKKGPTDIMIGENDDVDMGAIGIGMRRLR
jgi:hypothetical protein